MKKANTQNIVGSKVRIDWPMRWHASYGWKTQNVHLDNAKKDAEKEKLFGREGEIISYDTSDERGEYFRVQLEDGTTHKIPEGAFTILESPRPAGTRLMKLTKADGSIIFINPHHVCYMETADTEIRSDKCQSEIALAGDIGIGVQETPAAVSKEFAAAMQS